jgi:hypothetical protein
MFIIFTYRRVRSLPNMMRDKKNIHSQFPSGIPSARREKRISHARWKSMQLLWNMSIIMSDGSSTILKNLANWIILS